MDLDDSDAQFQDADIDNPVIKSIPIFLTPALAKYAVLHQVPHRPPEPEASKPLLPDALRAEPTAKISARLKPKTGRLELTVPLEVEEGIRTGRFNEGKAVEFQAESANVDMHRDPLSKITFRGESVPDQTNYCIAVFKDDTLHLTPMAQTIQLRPELSYLDNLSHAKRAQDRSSRNQAGNESSQEDSAEEADDTRSAKPRKATSQAKAVQVSVKSDGASGKSAWKDQATGRHDGSLFGPLRAEEAEQWVNLPYHTVDSKEANYVFDRMFSTSSQQLELLTRQTDHIPYS